MTFSKLLLHLFYGLRYDLSTISNLNSVFIILSLAPVFLLSKKWYQLFLKIIFIIVNSTILFFEIVDIKFFEFSKKRLTVDIFNSKWLGDDFISLIPNFIKDYWFFITLFAIFTYLLIKFYSDYNSHNLKTDKNNLMSILTRWIIRIIVIGISIVSSRGGLQLKPVTIISAAQYTNAQNSSLILNSSFSIVKTIGKPTIKHKHYFNETELNKIYSPVLQFEPKETSKKNVLIIILESFGKEYSGYLNNKTGYTPFLDSLMKKSLVFNKCFANGTSSMEALPSILSSIPSILGEPFITSPYSGNKINGLAFCLNQLGYKTSFYHGGKNGTMGFDNFTKLSGVKRYYGLNEYPNNDDRDGAWGIFDEPYLQYVAKELNKSKKPFCSGFFTLSSHHPYNIPKHLQNKFPKGKLINHESIGYTDYALNNFFKSASKMPWFNNTLFVLTADHTAQSEGGQYITSIGKYSIPLIFYSPTDTSLIGKSNITCSQTDILPSILDYLGYSKPFVSFGQSLFQDSVPHYSISRLNDVYQIIYDTLIITSNGDELFSAKKITNNDKIETIKIQGTIPDYLRNIFVFKQAFIQQYNNRMIDNVLLN